MDRHVLAAALMLVACRPETPRPPLGTHDGEVPVEVPFPPPVPRVEELGEAPTPTSVWVDGQWVFDGGGYAWEEGAWVEPAPGARYAPPTLVRRRNGELLYYSGTWTIPPPSPAPPSPGPSSEEPAP